MRFAANGNRESGEEVMLFTNRSSMMRAERSQFNLRSRAARTSRTGSSLLSKITALALLVAATAAAQLLPAPGIGGTPISGPATSPPPTATPVDPIMGFETATSWFVASTSPATRAALTVVRTQGSFALALSFPASQTTLTSQTVGSTTNALAGVGDVGAIFELDVLPGVTLPSGTTLTLSVISASLKLSNVEVGQVTIDGLHPGIYNTLQFPIADSLRTALGGAAFQDLTFRLVLKFPSNAPTPDGPLAGPLGDASILFDNLRVHSVPLVTATKTTKPPAGYGGTVDLVADGATPVSQSFPAAVVQVPDSFHLTQGTAGSTSVTLGLGSENGTAAFTCTYDPDTTDTTGQSYAVKSCTNGIEAGDLVGASFAKLTIVGGTSLMEVRAQLAKNPVGDFAGRGVIPPMPTFWGDIAGCVNTPAPPRAAAIQSTSCANQVAQINQIVTNYFNKVNAANVSPNYIVTGVPEFAQRHGDGSPHSTINAPHIDPSTGSGQVDLPFDQSGHMNPGGTFDAYWELKGDLNASSTPDANNPSGSDSTMNFNANLSGHVVVFGFDQNVASVQASAQSTSGSSSNASGSYEVDLLGNTVASGNFDVNTGFNIPLFSQSSELNLPPIQVWIFSVTVGATGSVGVTASGSLAATGFNVSLTPQATIGVHLEGGVSIGIASGGVDVRIDLLDIQAPITAQAGLFADTTPQFCDLTMKSALTGEVTISAGGGEVDLEATFGVCPFCYSASQRLLHWDPLVITTSTLFNVPLTPDFIIPLPTSVCAHPLGVTIVLPTGTAPVLDNLPQALVASVSGSDGNATCTWTGFAGNDQQPNPQGCSASAQFNSSGQRTLTVTATDIIPSTFGRTITETGSATITLNAIDLPPGVYILTTTPAPEFPCSFSSDGVSPSLGCTPHPQTLNGANVTLQESSFPAIIGITGEVTLQIPNTTTTFTATDSSGNTVTLAEPPCKGPLCNVGPILPGVVNPNQITVPWTVEKPGTYIITMTAATQGGTAPNQPFGVVVGKATTTINVVNGRSFAQ
jgi:hypothetical protein